MYDYKVQRAEIFTEEGQVKFIAIRDKCHELLRLSGAVMMEKLLIGSGHTWTMLACVDRLVELGEIRELTQENAVAGQYRVFISTNSRL